MIPFTALYHPWCLYLLGHRLAMRCSCTKYIDTLLENFTAYLYFFASLLACSLICTRALTISLEITALAPKGLITKPPEGFS